MSDTHEAVLGKIKALLKLAEDSRARGSLHEAEAAAARAAEMVQKYRLDAATIEASEPEDERQYEPIEEEDNEMFGGRTVPWRGILSGAICRANGCSSYYRRRYIAQQRRAVVCDTIIGRKSDIEIVKYTFAWLRLEVTKLADAYIETRKVHAGAWGLSIGQLRVAKNAFCLGAVAAIAESLSRGKAQAVAVHAQTAGPLAHKAGAMVLASKEAELAAYVKAKKLGSARSVTISDGGAYRAGHAAGSRIQTSHRAGLAGGGGRLLGGGS